MINKLNDKDSSYTELSLFLNGVVNMDKQLKNLKEKWKVKAKLITSNYKGDIILNDLYNEACFRYPIKSKEWYEFLLYGDEDYFNKFTKIEVYDTVDETGKLHKKAYKIFPCYDYFGF